MHSNRFALKIPMLVAPGLLWLIACSGAESGAPRSTDQGGAGQGGAGQGSAPGATAGTGSSVGGGAIATGGTAASGTAGLGGAPPSGGTASGGSAGSRVGGASVGGGAGTGGGGTAGQSGDPLTVLFDGSNLDNWVYDAHTKLVDATISIEGCWCLAQTKGDYDNFRLIVTSRVPGNVDFGNGHNGITFWGARQAGDLSPKRSFEITPLNCWTWDYVHNLSKAPGQTGSCSEAGKQAYSEWSTTELLANLKDGTIKSALNGVKQFDIKIDVAGGTWVKGPIGLQDHGKNLVQYKDIKVEINPVNSALITLKGP